jgi:riboflavin kinase/FMN adenylyltransferase
MMKLICGLKQASLLPEHVVATIGNFDGVHRGHQALIQRLSVKANELQCPLLVIVFEPQPGEYFHAEKAPNRLTSLREKAREFAKLGVDYVLCLKFTHSLSTLNAELFAKEILFEALPIKCLLVGKDFRFGKNRQGDSSLLMTIGEKAGVEVVVFSDYLVSHQRVSSTHIRELLQHDKLLDASRSLGRNYSVCGRVVSGDGRGQRMGIPTANLGLRRRILPVSGVYCVMVKRARDERVYQGVVNVGSRPTIYGQARPNLEVHLFDFDENLYHEMIEVIFIHKLRDEYKFESIDKLIKQIQLDIQTARLYFLVNANPKQSIVE